MSTSSSSSSMGEMEDGGRSGRGHVSALEMGNDDDDDDTEYYDDIDIRGDSKKKKRSSSRIISGEYGGISSSEDDDDNEQYAHLTTGTAPRRSRLLCTKQCWCILLTVVIAAFALLVKYDNNGNFALRNGNTFTPPWSTNINNKNDNVPMLGRPVTHSAYDTIQTNYIVEYTGRLTLYKHGGTGAEVLAYIPDLFSPTSAATMTSSNSKKDKDGNVGYDPKPDKVFGVAFRTKPESSTGVPHILEHSVLCGSTKYPSRDPFAHLLKGSLQTFLNAMTYPDRTVYPVASRNTVDFYNLMDVYLDAVFHPRAVTDEGWWVLRQEGWRYDVVVQDDDENDEDSENDDDGDVGIVNRRHRNNYDNNNSDDNRVNFEYKGVVYSEMKGAYSDPEGKLERWTQTLLFPDSPYYYDSGGDPMIIPTLTREEFVSFYNKYYHPTNSRLFVAGDEADVYHTLATIDRYISPMGYNPASREDSQIVYQLKTFDEPVRDRKPFAVSPDSTDGHMMCVTWLLNTEPMSAMMELAWIVLDGLLLGKPSSPLRKALEDSHLGEETIGGGLDNELLQSTFAIGMKGIKDLKDIDALEDLILDTLSKISSNGFNDDEVASTMNTIEFSLREGGGGLRGMEIFLGALTKWNYDASPTDALVYEDALKLMKDEIKMRGSKIFQQMITDSLVSNNHRVVLELYPSTTLEEEQHQATMKQISHAQSKMSDTDYHYTIEEGIKLKELQGTDETPEIIATNPALSISDIDPTSTEYPIHVDENAFDSGIRVLSHEVSSSGIAYVRLGLDISMIPYEDAVLLPSLITLLNEAGTSKMSDAEFRNYIGKLTGGVSSSLEIISVKPTGWDDQSKVLPGTNMLTMLFIQGKCTIDKISDLFDIFKLVLTDINIDDSQSILQNSLKSHLSSMKSNVASRGHSYANTRIRGRYSVRAFLDEKAFGVTSLESYTAILETVESDWKNFIIRIQDLRDSILKGNRGGMLLDITGDRKVLDAIMEKAETFLSKDSFPELGSDQAPPSIDFRSTPHPWVESAIKDMQIFDPLRDEGIAVATQVAYVGEGGRLYDVGESVKGSASVVSHYLTTGYMWDVIRAKNGAYGAYSQFSSTDGVATLYTYRDPNPPENTLLAFHAAAAVLLEDSSSSKYTVEEKNAAITTAIIGTIGDLDGSALSAQDAGWVALIRYLRGESAISRQRWRKEVIDTKVDDFVDFANRLKSWTPSIAVVASQSALDEMERDISLITV